MARNPQIYASDTVFCDGDSVILEVTYGFAHYAWNTGDSGRILRVGQGGWYVVDVTDSNGHHYYDSVLLHRYSPRALTYELDPDTNVVCAGTRVEFQLDTGFVEYYWNTGNRTSSATYILYQDKRIVVEAVDSNGCESRVVIEVSVVDCDTCNLIEHDSIVDCAEAVYVKARYGYDGYRWSDGSDDRIRWIDSSGWYYVEARRDTSWVCIDSVYIQLYPKPNLHVWTDPSNRVICEGDTIEIEVVNGFEHYWWNTGHTGRHAKLVLERSKTIVIEAVDSNGCEARIAFEVEVRACGDCELFGRDSIVHCVKDSIQLEADFGYQHYLWRDGTEGRLRWVHESGWYHLKARDSGHWCYDSIYVQLHKGKRLRFESNPDPLILCQGDSAVIELTPGFKLYHWNTGHTGSRAVLYPNHDTVIVIEALDSQGCEARLVIGIVVKRCTNGIHSLQTNGFRIYPNPSGGRLQIRIPGPEWIGERLSIWTTNGQLILDQEIRETEIHLDMSERAKGVYILRIGALHDRIILN